ncbi:GntR family transcriptional regulator [Yoonia litorea]|uniref:Transcriptional regulator, GntR family n=1 Tax=Yoonia litorea TaxID=1123755 RepID=A0A1I6ME00_9RHOB|nr:GntR family transcriptional regulator [Yoonia litorea]SFS13949.1 transcriptional regulator, GntR family [Yoonia litorea]
MTQARYTRVATRIATDIDAGRYSEREALPPERALSDQFGVSRDTMRKAIKLLEEQGYLVSRRGSGTFVAPKTLRSAQSSIDGWTDYSKRLGRRAGQKVLSVEIIAPPMAVAGLLSVTGGTSVVHVERVRYLDDLPLGVHESYLVLPQPKRLTRTALEREGSLYHLLEKEFGIALAEATDTISAVAASSEDAKWLEVEPGSPLLRVERLTLSKDLMPIEYSDMRHIRAYTYDTAVRRRPQP